MILGLHVQSTQSNNDNENVTSEMAPRVSIRLTQIVCKESRTVLQKIFQHNVCNNNNFILETVSETYGQCVRHSVSRQLQTTSRCCEQ